ncbi:MAG TPA: alpha/beta hydrolase [Burkholderiaceae bacterium]|nr:alpha/beta hydrolase [Burkholderiaceae bacterium]
MRGKSWFQLALWLGMTMTQVLQVARAAGNGETVQVLDTGRGTLDGSLRLPEGTAPAPWPVALIIAGSGPTDRDGNSAVLPGRNNGLRMLADALAAVGIASLRYDKRGVGASAQAAPVEARLRFDDYVDDAVAWARWLAADPRFSSVGVVGHSEGALIGLLSAQRGPAAWYVSIAGPAQPASALLRRQLQDRLPPPLADTSEAILQSLERGETVAEVPVPLMALYRPTVQPYLVSWFRHDPAKSIAGFAKPCLIVQGDTDIQVATDDARVLQAAQPACGLQLVAGMNHVLKPVPADPGQQRMSYSDPILPLAPGLIPALTDFILRVR